MQARLTLPAHALVKRRPADGVARDAARRDLDAPAGVCVAQAGGEDDGVGVGAGAPGVVARGEGVAEAEDAEGRHVGHGGSGRYMV